VNSTLFTRKMVKDLFCVKYMLMILYFGSTNKLFCDEFRNIMINMFEMSMMEELKYFF
jgi:hypothetical protein